MSVVWTLSEKCGVLLYCCSFYATDNRLDEPALNVFSPCSVQFWTVTACDLTRVHCWPLQIFVIHNAQSIISLIIYLQSAFFQAALKLFGVLWHLVDTVLVCFRQDQIESCKEAFIQGRIYCVNFLGYCKEIINSYHPHNGLKVQFFHFGHR